MSGTSFTQADGSTLTEQKTISYDAYGTIVAYTSGSGVWNLTYDQLSRRRTVTDPDGVTAYAYYFADGTLSAVESAYQHSLGGTSQAPGPAAVAFTYDADGNKVSETHHHGCSTMQNCAAGVTRHWYDGADRLIETQLPQDPNDLFACIPFVTRYDYDLTRGGQNSIYGSGNYSAYGNLFKTQRYMPQVTVASSLAGYCGGSPPATMGWVDVSGSAYDALNRKTAELSYQPGTSTIVSTALTYDTSYAGLVVAKTNGRGDITNYIYDSNNRISGVSFAQGHCDHAMPWNECDYLPASTLPAARQITYDADGRAALIATSAFGSQTYTYDNDGHLSSSAEPTGGSGLSWLPGSGNLSSPATLTYSYYPNGWKSGVSVSSSATATQPIQISYAYRADGQTTRVSSAFAGIFAFGYTAAGRRTSQADFSNLRTLSYDSFGREVSDSVAGNGSLANFTYDLEGGSLGYQMGVSQYGAVTFTYNVRGELSSEFNSANGFAYPTNQSLCGVGGDRTACVIVGTVFDPRTNANLGQQSIPDPTMNCSYGGPYCSPVTVPSFYDSAARAGDARFWGDPNPSEARSYFDVEDHTVWSLNGASGSFASADSYGWGPNGHPIFDQGTNGPPAGSNTPASFQRTIHWDGADPLFITAADGSIRQINLPGLGSMVPNDRTFAGFTVWDRDPSGTVISSHNSTGSFGLSHPLFIAERELSEDQNGNLQVFYNCLDASAGVPTANYRRPDAFNPIVVQEQSCTPILETYGGVGFPPAGDDSNLLFDLRGEGLSDGNTNIQGVRASSSDTIQWTTPDLYAGKIGDPLSQQRYMWNRNNPVDYLDPSGYDAIFEETRYVWAKIGIFIHSYLRIVDDEGNTKVLLSFGPTNGDNRLQPASSEDGNTIIDEHLVAWCWGKCTDKNGGFDEDRAIAKAKAIDAAADRYAVPFNDSDTVERDICAAGKGKGASCHTMNGDQTPTTVGPGRQKPPRRPSPWTVQVGGGCTLSSIFPCTRNGNQEFY